MDIHARVLGGELRRIRGVHELGLGHLQLEADFAQHPLQRHEPAGETRRGEAMAAALGPGTSG